MSTTPTANYGWGKPNNGADNNNWGIDANALYDAVDAQMFSVSTVASAALPASGGPLTGRVDAKNGTVALTVYTGVTGTQAFDLSTANVFSATVTGTVTFTLTNVPATANAAIPLVIRVTNGGSHVTWFAGIKWANGAGAPALTASGTDMLVLMSFDQGTTWDQMGFQQNVS
jgi:hypothetical protein